MQEETVRRVTAVDELFRQWDLSGSGCVRYSELLQILQASQRLGTKEQSKWVKRLEAQIAQGKRANSLRSGSVVSMSLANIGGAINFSEVTGEPSLDPVAFASLISHLTEKDSPKEFDDFVQFCGEAVKEASRATQGTMLQRDIWEMFRSLDSTNSGFIFLDDLASIIGDKYKKVLLRWKYYLRNNQLSRKSSMPQKSSAQGEDLFASGSSGVAAAMASLAQNNRASFCFDDGSTEQEYAADEDDENEERLTVTLPDFQKFMHEIERRDQHTFGLIRQAIQKAIQDRQIRYILNFRVADIMNDIMEDLLKERPVDVLSGIVKSVDRLRRADKYPRPVVPRNSIRRSTVKL